MLWVRVPLLTPHLFHYSVEIMLLCLGHNVFLFSFRMLNEWIQIFVQVNCCLFSISLSFFLGSMFIIYSLCICIFLIGVCGVFFSRTNILLVLMSLELMLLSVSIISVFSSLLLDDLIGQFFTLFILTIGASESAIGLALIVCYYNGYKYT